MDTLAQRTIAALRTNHDDLAALVPGLSATALSGPSAASDWTIAQVLSHLGSGAEITLAGLEASLSGEPAPGQGFNESVWDRWNALSAAEQATGFVAANAALLAAYEALTDEQREQTMVTLGFVPFPLTLAALAGLRLNEAALHAWDVHAAFDPAASVSGDAAAVLAEHLSGEMSFMLGFLGKADRLDRPAVVDVNGLGLSITDEVGLSPTVSDPTATFAGPMEAALRLVAGRLGPTHTPPDVAVSGNVTLEDLRGVFPGF